MDEKEKIALGQKIMEKLIDKKSFTKTNVTEGREDANQIFKKFCTNIWIGFYCSDKGVFSFGWCFPFDEVDEKTSMILKQILEKPEFDEYFSNIHEYNEQEPWIWREWEGDYDKPFDEIYAFFAEKYDRLEEYAKKLIA
jgi:hypothetical protein